MERNLKFTIAYDGGEFHGWQWQRDVRTVQEEIETVARRVVRHPLNLVGASRTDAGVHARGQVAHLRTTCTIPADNLRRAIGCRLPTDIAIVRVAEVPSRFHATRDAIRKLYRYRIHNDGRRPVEQHAVRRAWHVWFPLDVERMQLAADRIAGKRDFAAFASAGSPRSSTVRTVFRIHVQRRFDTIVIDVEGDGFLYNQVRNIAGTLVEVGRGRWAPEHIDTILTSADRQNAGPTAPAAGLSLEWIEYPTLGSYADGA